MTLEGPSLVAGVLLLAAAAAPRDGLAHDHSKHAGESFNPGVAVSRGSADADVASTPLYQGLGSLHFAVTTASSEAQACALLLLAGRAEESVATFQQALRESPRNGWALWGLSQAQRALGGEVPAATELAVTRAWLGEPGLLSLDRL